MDAVGTGNGGSAATLGVGRAVSRVGLRRSAESCPDGVCPLDLTRALEEWPYEPGQINVRLIDGEDGTPKIQMRLDLGILQMEVSGRPDGQRPYGCESLLEYYETEADERAHGDEVAEGDAGGFTLSPEDCRLLREEAVQYYHRYISLMVLGEFDGVIRDTSRNLRLLDFTREFAEEEDDQQILEQFRSYISMMRARALASLMVESNEPKAALLAIDFGLEHLKKLYDETGQANDYEGASEVQLLRGMRDELSLKLPPSAKAELKERLRKAIEEENYRLAAILRDELRAMKD